MPNRSKADAFVAGKDKTEPQVEMRRFTMEIPVRLHSRIKATCALRDQPVTMSAAIRELLEREFPET